MDSLRETQCQPKVITNHREAFYLRINQRKLHSSRFKHDFVQKKFIQIDVFILMIL